MAPPRAVSLLSAALVGVACFAAYKALKWRRHPGLLKAPWTSLFKAPNSKH